MKFPLRGPKKPLPMRSRRWRRLQLLQAYQPEQVYTLVPIRDLDDVPEELLLWKFEDVSDDNEPDDDELDEFLDDKYGPVNIYGHA